MILETLPVVQQLSADDKIRLWEEPWDQIAADESRWPAREDHLALLNERLEHYRAHPETASTWEDVRRRLEVFRRRRAGSAAGLRDSQTCDSLRHDCQ